MKNEKGTIPYQIKIYASEIDVLLKKFCEKMEETYNNDPLNEILENARANREAADLYLMLMDGNYLRYGTWDNFSDNFKTSKLKATSLASNFASIINGMINDIKRLEKENEKKLTASHAKEIAESNGGTIDDILDSIKQSSEMGRRYIAVQLVSDEVLEELKKLKYNITSPIADIIKITW